MPDHHQLEKGGKVRCSVETISEDADAFFNRSSLDWGHMLVLAEALGQPNIESSAPASDIPLVDLVHELLGLLRRRTAGLSGHRL